MLEMKTKQKQKHFDTKCEGEIPLFFACFKLSKNKSTIQNVVFDDTMDDVPQIFSGSFHLIYIWRWAVHYLYNHSYNEGPHFDYSSYSISN